MVYIDIVDLINNKRGTYFNYKNLHCSETTQLI